MNISVDYKDGFLVCKNCSLRNEKDFYTKRRLRMISHIKEHIETEDTKRIFDTLSLDFALNGDLIKTDDI